MTGRGFHGLWGFAGGTDAACVCDRRWLPTREFEAHLVAERVAAVLHDDATVEAVARALAQIQPDEDWPTNEALGGGPTGTRDDEYRWATTEEARDLLAVLAERLGVPHE